MLVQVAALSDVSGSWTERYDDVASRGDRCDSNKTKVAEILMVLISDTMLDSVALARPAVQN